MTAMRLRAHEKWGILSLRPLLFNYALRFCPEARRWYDRKAAKRHKVIAIKAVAHKLARAGYYLIRDGGEFDAARAFG